MAKRRNPYPGGTRPAVDPAVADQCLILVIEGRTINSLAEELNLHWDVLSNGLKHAKLRRLVSGSPVRLPWSSVLELQAAWKRSA